MSCCDLPFGSLSPRRPKSEMQPSGCMMSRPTSNEECESLRRHDAEIEIHGSTSEHDRSSSASATVESPSVAKPVGLIIGELPVVEPDRVALRLAVPPPCLPAHGKLARGVREATSAVANKWSGARACRSRMHAASVCGCRLIDQSANLSANLDGGGSAWQT